MNEDAANLDRLHDILVPPPAGWWPPAPGWWVVLATMAILALLFLLRAFVHRQRNVYRHEALARLNALDLNQSDELVREVNTLLKRAALSAWPREEVAGLCGREWLAFLDRTGDTDGFSHGPGSILDMATPVNPRDVAASEGLIQAARHWLMQHRREVER